MVSFSRRLPVFREATQPYQRYQVVTGLPPPVQLSRVRGGLTGRVVQVCGLVQQE
jgi:hypothetical protein